MHVLLVLFLQRHVVITTVVPGLMKMRVIGMTSELDIPNQIRLQMQLLRRLQERMNVGHSRSR